MKTKMKSDALLDAFDKQQLSKNEMSELSGGDYIFVKYVTPSGIMLHKVWADGSTQYFNLIGSEMTAGQVIEGNDHYIV